ncbi:MAG: DinB family protein [Gemmatimonadaceae bacterium]
MKTRSRLTALILPFAISATALHSARAQDVMDAKSTAYLRDEYRADLDTVHAKIMALATAIPEDKYSWRPAPGVRSISEALMHVASEYYFFVPGSIGAKPPADFGPPRETLPKMEKITGKAAVIAELEKGWAHSAAQFAATDAATLTGKYKPWGGSLAQNAFGMAGDLHEHLGQLISYARAVGVKPPWSK